MLQTTLSVPLDVIPESAAHLKNLVEAFRAREDAGTGPGDENFSRMIAGLPTLHFMSMTVFQDGAYDPVFIIEVNCDEAIGPFWADLEVLAGEDIRAMLRCCKRPHNHNGPLYDAVTAKGSTASIIPYLEAMTQRPSVFHHGNRGLYRDRIEQESQLFRAVRTELDAPQDNGQNKGYFGKDPVQLHQALRAKMQPHFLWLDDTPAPRISIMERIRDFARLGGVVMLLLFVLSFPGMIVSLFVPWLIPLSTYIGGCVLLGGAMLFHVVRTYGPLPWRGLPQQIIWRTVLIGLLGIVALALLMAGLALAVTWVATLFNDMIAFIWHFGGWWHLVAGPILLGQFSLLVTVPPIVMWLRREEVDDSSQDMADIDPAMVAAMLRREDWLSQNHMSSLVNIRPGVLRTWIITIGHLGLGLFLRATATSGYLGSMRTVHFAHWAFLNNGSRLLFLSNYDQNWGAYLDDFIEKAHTGLTLAWGSSVGFPQTSFLIYDGASQGHLFKEWALASRTVTRLWISAYRDLSVNQVERNNRIATGLHKTSLSPAEATIWVRDL